MRNLIAAENEGQEKKDDQRNFISAQRMSIAKGQLIWKCLYCVFNSSKK